MSYSLFRALLWFYPREFRETHGRDWWELHRDAHSGTLAVVSDVVRSLPAAWRDAWRHRARGEPTLRRSATAGFVDRLRQDLRDALRSLKAKPTFTAIALATLVLGIGANTAIFSVVNWVVLRPFPYPDADALVRVWWRPASFNQHIVSVFADRSHSFESLSAFAGWAFTLSGEAGEAPQEVNGAQVSPNHFDVVGVAPFLGRGFVEDEARAGRSHVVVLSYGLWQQRFGGDPKVLGQRIRLSGAGRNAFTVIGVMPADYSSVGEDQPWQLWVPLETAAELVSDDSWFLSVIARLKTGVTVEQATVDVKVVAKEVKDEWYPRTSEDEVARARVARLENVIVGPEVRAQLWVLLAAVGIVLVVACANVANLLLVRAGDREREIAVRSALGAGRARILRQLVGENLVLGLIGGGLGAGLAVTAVTLFATELPAELPRAAGLHVDGHVLAFSVLLSLLSGLVFGLAPAMRATGVTAMDRLRLGGSTVRSMGRARLHRLLIVGEVGASVVLVAAAGFLVQSFWRLTQVDPGFEPDQVLVVGVYTPDASYTEPEERRAFYRELLERLAALPEVEAAGSIHIPPMGLGSWDFPYYPQGHVIGARETPPSASFRVVSPGYFRSMSIPVLAGRDLERSDRHDAPGVGLINATMAKQTWPNEDAVGKEIAIFGPDGPKFTVIGVVADVRQHALRREPTPEMYRPLEQWTLARNFITLRTGTAHETLAPRIRDVVHSQDPAVPVVHMGSMLDLVSGSVATPRFVTVLLAVFAGLALFLAAIGIYGVTSSVVRERTGEIGLRMALGANGRRVLIDSIARGMKPVLIGLVLGVIGAAWSTRLLESLLFRTDTGDPVTYGLVVLFLAIVALLACFVPARRASRVDPLVALRFE